MNKKVGVSAIKQFVSYFCVGGMAAAVEWVMFAIFANIIGINYILATCFSFVFSTTTNWFLGRIWTFKSSKTYEKQKVKEILMIFLVSAVGLLFNIGLMYLFVTVIGWNTSILRSASKVVATGMVFIWNFLIRKFVVYK